MCSWNMYSSAVCVAVQYVCSSMCTMCSANYVSVCLLIQGLEDLKVDLQQALDTEIFIIPPYLTAMISLKNGADGPNKAVYNIIHDVVVQEMLHVGLVANVLNAVGGKPQFTNTTFLPKYPSHVPGGIAPGLVMLLEKCSISQIQQRFVVFETPEATISFVREEFLLFLKYRSKRQQQSALNKAIEICRDLTSTSAQTEKRYKIVEVFHNDTIGEFYDRIMCKLALLNHRLGHKAVFSGTCRP